MAYMNRFSQSDEGRRDELIRIIEHSVERPMTRISYVSHI